MCDKRKKGQRKVMACVKVELLKKNKIQVHPIRHE